MAKAKKANPPSRKATAGRRKKPATRNKKTVIKRRARKPKDEGISSEIIFDSTKNNTDMLFVETAEPVQPSQPATFASETVLNIQKVANQEKPNIWEKIKSWFKI